MKMEVKMKEHAKILPVISIGFSEAWWHKYYNENNSGKDRRRLLFERFGDVGLGEENPSPPEPYVGGEYGDRFMSAFWGCEIVYIPGQAPGAMILPDAWSHMENLEVPDVETSPIAQKAFEDARKLKERYGYCRAGVNFGGPLNNAVSVFGSDILAACASEPELAQRVLQKMGEAVLLVHDQIVCKINGIDPAETRKGGWGVGNCPVCMISPETYRKVVLPSDLWLRDQFQGEYGLHHCGIFDTYTEVYQPLKPSSLDLGPGTDLRIARKAYPDAKISTYIDVGALAKMNQADIDALIAQMIDHASPAELFTVISVADVGPEISDEIVRNLMTIADRI
jgi:hypothetical protein